MHSSLWVPNIRPGRLTCGFAEAPVVGSELGRTTRSTRIDLRSAAAVEVSSALASQRCRDAAIESAAIVSDSGLHRRGRDLVTNDGEWRKELGTRESRWTKPIGRIAGRFGQIA
jgi:hypothetical protein